MDFRAIVPEGVPSLDYLHKAGTDIVTESYHSQHLLDCAVAGLGIVAVVDTLGRNSERTGISHHYLVCATVNA